MDTQIARNIAHAAHVGRRDRFGEPLIEHVERVAAAVPENVRAVAFLHDLLEHSEAGPAELAAAGPTALELATIRLLTRAPDESYEAHVLRVAHAAGPEGRIARVVRLADLDDHLSHREMPHGAPPYGWARMHVANGQARHDGAGADRAAADRAAA